MAYIRHIVLLGPPGSGKGTQGQALAKELGVPHVATGDLLREIVASGSPEGERFKSIMAQGKLIADQDVVDLVAKRLVADDAKNGFVLDGFPRSLGQARMFDLTEAGIAVGRVVAFDVAEEPLVARLSGRLTCLKCGASYHEVALPPSVAGTCDKCGELLVKRPDDEPTAIRQRLAVYTQTTEPLIEHYAGKGVLRKIDAFGSTDDVRRRLTDSLQA
jgi:adenylate kinase